MRKDSYDLKNVLTKSENGWKTPRRLLRK